MGLVSGPVKQFLPECRHERVIAVVPAFQELGDRQRGDGLVAVEEPRPVGDLPPAAGRSVAVATIRPSISRCMKPSPILIGMRNPLPPRGATKEPYGSHQPAGNPANPASMTECQGIRGANYGSQCPPAPPDSPRPPGANLQGEAPRPTPSDRPGHRIRALGVKGSPVQIRPSRPGVARSEGVSGLARGPFLIFGSQAGSHPGWCFLVSLRDGLGRCGPVRPFWPASC